MESFDGLTNSQIQRGLQEFNKLKKFSKNEDIYYSRNGYLVIGPNAITITRNLVTRKKPHLEINWKNFHSSNLKNGIALRKKNFVLVEYVIRLENNSKLEHLAVLYVDPREKTAQYVDSYTPNFDKMNLDKLEQEVPWESLYGVKTIKPYFYKYDGGIPNACVLDCLHSIDRIMSLNSFEKAAAETIFLRRVRRLQDNKINIEFHYKRSDYISYFNGIRYCYDILLNKNIFKLKLKS